MKIKHVFLIILLTFCSQGTLRAQNYVLPYNAKDKTMGVVNCASSLCHGSITPWKASNVLQNEYVTWSRLDKHARAYDVLLNQQSQKIAKNLGLKEPAHKAKICLDCHTHNVSTAQRGERFNLSDGVSCEACHGPAERWISFHTEPNASHEKNIQQGLYPLSNSTARAKVCLSCHSGNQDKFVNHRMMGAGHPRMSFELETFSNIAPAHFRVDKDYQQRKQAWDGVKVWAIGQALAVSEMMDILNSPKRGRDGMFPELVLFDCHACHHPMSDKRWKPANTFGVTAGPGVARLNDSGMLMMRAIARKIDPALGARVNAQVRRLHNAAAGQGNPSAEAAALKRLSNEVVARIDRSSLSQSDLRGIALGLIDDGLAGSYRDYAGAEQATMAIGSVVNFMHKRGLVGSAVPVNVGLDRLNASLANDEKYRPAEFQQRLREFRALIAKK
jgi:Cytochrome c554 and c-prime